LATEKGFNMIESYKNKRKENNNINQ